MEYGTDTRCPPDAFYEWQVMPDGKTKIPHAIARADGQPMALASLWEGWRGADGTVIRSFVIITTNANEALRPLHDRMPVLLEPAEWPIWLDQAIADPASLLRPSATLFRVRKVGTGVNNVRNDTSDLLQSIDV